MTFSKNTRTAIIEKQKGKCYNCENPGVEIHHLIANTKLNQKLYGKQLQSEANGVYVCKDCHNNHSWDKKRKEKLKKNFKINSKIK